VVEGGSGGEDKCADEGEDVSDDRDKESQAIGGVRLSLSSLTSSPSSAHLSSPPLPPSTTDTLALTLERLFTDAGDAIWQGQRRDALTPCKRVITNVNYATYYRRFWPFSLVSLTLTYSCYSTTSP
jgi:hypothetical protein